MKRDIDAVPDLLGAARGLTPPLYELARVLRFHGIDEAGLFHLPPSELEVLRYVLHEPGVRLTVLARELGLHASNVSATVRTLVARDLIHREPDPADRRSVRLMPTLGAVHGMARIEEAWVEIFAQALDDLTPQQHSALSAAVPSLRALADALRIRRTDR
ncbi:MarR family winged helix-turn-helix transcriptional regulator [Nonomuraea jabiensis]|uniref:MarR family winged helix-turn-helix transcriptional regulator n=1 Tax=Nonomuraea jabiensis TaxID=882448 RepID=UPI00368DFD25